MEETPYKQIEMANLKKEQASNSLSIGQTIVTDIKLLSGYSGTGWQRETGTGRGGNQQDRDTRIIQHLIIFPLEPHHCSICHEHPPLCIQFFSLIDFLQGSNSWARIHLFYVVHFSPGKPPTLWRQSILRFTDLAVEPCVKPLLVVRVLSLIPPSPPHLPSLAFTSSWRTVSLRAVNRSRARLATVRGCYLELSGTFQSHKHGT